MSAAGLCETCVHSRVLTSGRGSTFWRCGLHESEPCFPKYPRLPVLACSGHLRAEPAQRGEE
jgi:hypothetical protein